MKSLSAGLQTLLDTAEYVFRFELLTITLAAGAGVYRFNSSDMDLNYNGHIWLSGDQAVNLGFKRGPITTELGTDAKIMELTLFHAPTTNIGGVPVPEFANAGGFDNAIIEVDCLPVPLPIPFTNGVPVPDTSRGTYNIWTGICGDARADRSQTVLEVSSLMRILQGAFPRNFALPTCNNTLYDTACTLSQATFKVTGSVASGSTTTAFTTGLTQADDYFDLGWITFTSGLNNGLPRTVKTYKHSTGSILLTYPLPNVPAGGDTFNIFPGCDKTQPTCTNKFNNLANFRGFPFVPNPMVLLAGMGTSPVAGGGGGMGSENTGSVGGTGGVSTTFKLK